MITRLILMRHAKSSWKYHDLSDHERPLNKRGRKAAVKVAKENHDLRFDIPCLGDRTLEVCASVGISIIAFEADRTLLLNSNEVETLSKKHSISVIAV